MKISAIEQNKYFKKRFIIFVEGAYFSGVSAENLKRLNISAGDDCSKEFLNGEIIEREKREALDYMLKILEIKSATEAELILKAKRKSFCAPAVSYAVGRLYDMGLIDDKAFSARYTETASRTKGKRRIAFELQMKGVNENDAEEALENIGDEFDTAFALSKKRLKEKPLSQKEKERLIRFLIYRGFNYETVRAVIKKLSGEEIGYE